MDGRGLNMNMNLKMEARVEVRQKEEGLMLSQKLLLPVGVAIRSKRVAARECRLGRGEMGHRVVGECRR